LVIDIAQIRGKSRVIIILAYVYNLYARERAVRKARSCFPAFKNRKTG
jgi:hypothetical protein